MSFFTKLNYLTFYALILLNLALKVIGAEEFSANNFKANKKSNITEIVKAKTVSRPQSKAEWLEYKDKLLKSSSTDKSYFYSLGLAELNLGNYTAAEKALRDALALDIDYPQALVTLAQTHLKLHKSGEKNQRDHLRIALGCAARAVGNEPTSAVARNVFASILSLLGWTQAAEDEFFNILTMHPSDAMAHYNLALLQLKQDKPSYELARRHYQTAVSLGVAKNPKLEAIFEKK